MAHIQDYEIEVPVYHLAKAALQRTRDEPVLQADRQCDQVVFIVGSESCLLVPVWYGTL